MQNIPEIVNNMRNYFNTGVTKDVNFRIEQLKKFKKALKAHEQDFFKALRDDFNKPEFESYATEICLVYQEIDDKIKHLKKWAKPQRVGVGLSSFPSHGLIIPEPYGVTLVMAPWNYPYMLTLCPVVGALAAGNCCLIKPSNRSPHTTDMIKLVCDEIFDPGYVSVVLGGHEENTILLDLKFDFIFFTGGVKVGKIVLEKASKYLCPCVLELGGKSPVFIDKDCDLKNTVKRLVWGKYTNGGQTCVAPDYVMVDEEIHDEFIEMCKKQIDEFYYNGTELSNDFPQMINNSHFEKVSSFIDSSKVVKGGKVDSSRRIVEPTIMTNVSLADHVMEEEIFGPIMPVLKIKNFEEGLEIAKKVNGGAKPLACYVFTNDKKKAQYILDNLSFGGGCVNDTLMHVATEALPFGGVENSGMGAYHGKRTFDCFTHYKGVVVKHKIDLPIRYPKYTDKKLSLMKKLLK